MTLAPAWRLALILRDDLRVGSPPPASAGWCARRTDSRDRVRSARRGCRCNCGGSPRRSHAAGGSWRCRRGCRDRRARRRHRAAPRRQRLPSRRSGARGRSCPSRRSSSASPTAEFPAGAGVLGHRVPVEQHLLGRLGEQRRPTAARHNGRWRGSRTCRPTRRGSRRDGCSRIAVDLVALVLLQQLVGDDRVARLGAGVDGVEHVRLRRRGRSRVRGSARTSWDI